jgi:hypothetical protein
MRGLRRSHHTWPGAWAGTKIRFDVFRTQSDVSALRSERRLFAGADFQSTWKRRARTFPARLIGFASLIRLRRRPRGRADVRRYASPGKKAGRWERVLAKRPLPRRAGGQINRGCIPTAGRASGSLLRDYFERRPARRRRVCRALPKPARRAKLHCRKYAEAGRMGSSPSGVFVVDMDLAT